jgi:hypothetical protein
LALLNSALRLRAGFKRRSELFFAGTSLKTGFVMVELTLPPPQAVCHALFLLSGQRVRSLPLKQYSF